MPRHNKSWVKSKVMYKVFDIPNMNNTPFEERMVKLEEVVNERNRCLSEMDLPFGIDEGSSPLTLTNHFKVRSRKHLKQTFEEVLKFLNSRAKVSLLITNDWISQYVKNEFMNKEEDNDMKVEHFNAWTIKGLERDAVIILCPYSSSVKDPDTRNLYGRSGDNLDVNSPEVKLMRRKLLVSNTRAVQQMVIVHPPKNVTNLTGKHDDEIWNSIEKKDILPWHSDQAYGGNKNVEVIKSPNIFYLKFFFYLTNVGPNNGCTSYIPCSHKITYAVRSCIFEKKVNYEPFWSLDDLVKFIKKKENYKHILEKLSSEEELNNFFKKADLISTNPEKSFFDFEASPGDLLIFNDSGVHRGSMPSLNTRIALRYLYKKNSF